MTLSLSTDNVKLTPGQTLDVMVTLSTSVALEQPVVLSLRSPGDEALPSGLNAAFDPPLLSPAPGQDATAKLHLLAQTALSEDSYPLVAYARNKSEEASSALSLTLLGGESNWRRPISTSGTDQVVLMSGDHSDGVYVVVNTTGGLAGYVNQSIDFDTYLIHYRGNGALSFVTPLSTARTDIISSIAVDADDSVYLAGYTYGTLPGQTSQGGADGFIAKVNSSGGLVWLKQIGTTEFDQATGIALAPDGSLFVAGLTEGVFPGYANAGASDVFVGHYKANGEKDWVVQFGSDADERAYNVLNQIGVAITVDGAGNPYVAGSTLGAFAGSTSQGNADAFVARLSPTNGDRVWLKQVGSYAEDALYTIVAHPNGNIYAAGYAKGPFPGQIQMGGQDALLLAYKSDGTQAVARQIGTSYADQINGLTVTGDRIYIAGTTRGGFPGQTQYGLQDAFYMRLTPEGSTLWLRQLGTTQADEGRAIAASLGSGKFIYYGGLTWGDWTRDFYIGESDGFVNQYPLD